MQPTRSSTGNPGINPFPLAEIALLQHYQENIAPLFLEGKKGSYAHRDIERIFNEILPFLASDAKDGRKLIPQQQNFVLVKIETLIDHLRSLGRPIPKEFFALRAKYRFHPGSDPSSFQQREKELQKLLCDHNIDMELFKTSKSRFNAKRAQIETRSTDILSKINSLTAEIRLGVPTKQLHKIKQQICQDISLIFSQKKLKQRPSAFLSSPSPLTTTRPSFRDINLDGTKTLSATGITINTVSSNSD